MVLIDAWHDSIESKSWNSSLRVSVDSRRPVIRPRDRLAEGEEGVFTASVPPDPRPVDGDVRAIASHDWAVCK